MNYDYEDCDRTHTEETRKWSNSYRIIEEKTDEKRDREYYDILPSKWFPTLDYQACAQSNVWLSVNGGERTESETAKQAGCRGGNKNTRG